MFFDESYCERFYRYKTVSKFCDDSDCLIVIGTALATGFANSIVKGFLKKELPVIEINLESAIDKGFNIQVLEKSEISLPALFSEYYRLVKNPVKAQKSSAKVPSPKGTKNQTSK